MLSLQTALKSWCSEKPSLVCSGAPPVPGRQEPHPLCWAEGTWWLACWRCVLHFCPSLVAQSESQKQAQFGRGAVLVCGWRHKKTTSCILSSNWGRSYHSDRLYSIGTVLHPKTQLCKNTQLCVCACVCVCVRWSLKQTLNPQCRPSTG